MVINHMVNNTTAAVSLRNENQLLLRRYVVGMFTYVRNSHLGHPSPTYNFSGHIGRLN